MSLPSKIPLQKANEPVEAIIIYDPDHFEEYYDQVRFLCFICKSKPNTHICDDCNNFVCYNCVEEKMFNSVECTNCLKERMGKMYPTLEKSRRPRTKLVKT